MRASKENCQDAMAKLEALRTLLAGSNGVYNQCFDSIKQFLEAAEKKLPKESSFAKDMLRDAGRKK